MKATILIVEDDEHLRKQMYWALKEEYEVLEAGDATSAIKMLEKTSFVDGVLLDLHLPPNTKGPEEGLKLLSYIRDFYPDTGIIVMTGSKNRKAPQEAIKLGVRDFFSKPFELDELKLTLKRVLHMLHLEKKVKIMQQELERKYSFKNIVGKSKKMKDVFELVSKIAPTSSTILIRGESGTGKELIAKAIHYSSPRKNFAFVPVNCAALPEGLLEAELFGHEKGAFTDATFKKKGMFEIADKGTIFLDEIADMSLMMQAKILRVLQEKNFTRLGSTKPIKTDVRVVAATNKDIEKMIKEGKFREDLYYRLNVVTISIPPLRERKEDIPLLVQHFLTGYSTLHKKKIKGISSEVMEKLCEYHWPGNVRELENVIERAVILSNGNVITLGDLPPNLQPAFFRQEPFPLSLNETEKKLIISALHSAQGNQSKAARILGIHRNTLRRKIKKYNINLPE